RRPRGRGRLTQAPFECRLLPDPRVWISQQPAVSLDDIAVSLGDWQGTKQALPLLREEGSDAAAEQPVELGAAAGRNAEQDELADPARVLFGIRKRQRAAPGAAKHEPPLDSDVLAQQLDVGDEIRGAVVCEIDV